MGRRRITVALAGLLIGLVLASCAGPGDVSALHSRVEASGRRVVSDLGNVDRRTSETSYRSAVASGAARVFAGRGYPLRRPLRCRSLRTADQLDISCSGTTVDGHSLLVDGTTTRIDQPNPNQDYRLAVDGRQVWQGSCLGDSCRARNATRPALSSESPTPARGWRPGR